MGDGIREVAVLVTDALVQILAVCTYTVCVHLPTNTIPRLTVAGVEIKLPYYVKYLSPLISL